MSSDFSCMILDIGTTPKNITTIILQALPSKEISLKEMWDELAIGDNIPVRIGNNEDDSLKPRFYTYQETVEATKYYDTCIWVPQAFYGKFRATIKQLKNYRCLVIDLDPKVDSLFWTKIYKMFRIWASGKLVNGIPMPHFVSFSGNGIHLYWLMKHENATYKIKLIASVALRLIILKLSSLFESQLDKIHIVQAFRVTGAKTKDGKGVCRTFKILNNDNEYILKDFLIQCFDDNDKEFVDLFMNNKCKYNDLRNRLNNYGEIVKKNVVNKPKKIVEKSTHKEYVKENKIDVVDEFNADTIGFFSEIIDKEESCRRKDFAKKLIYGLKLQSPIKCGCRNNRLYGLSIGLAKCGCTKTFIVRVVNLVNEYYCDEPMTEREISCCYANPHKYIYVRESKLREYLGIDRWSVFIKRKSIMSRKQAAKKASSSSHKNTIKKLIDGYNDLGFDVSISELCRHTGVSRQTYNRYKNSGVLSQEVFGYFINCCNYNNIKLNNLINSMRIKEGNDVVINGEPQITDQYFLAMTSEAIADDVA